MELHRPKYPWKGFCDICGQAVKQTVDLEPELFCPKCSYTINITRICKECILEALKLIEEGE